MHREAKRGAYLSRRSVRTAIAFVAASSVRSSRCFHPAQTPSQLVASLPARARARARSHLCKEANDVQDACDGEERICRSLAESIFGCYLSDNQSHLNCRRHDSQADKKCGELCH